jgi:hypothetical protein
MAAARGVRWRTDTDSELAQAWRHAAERAEKDR